MAGANLRKSLTTVSYTHLDVYKRQGVELVRSFAMSASGLANAVLRKIVLMRQAFPFGDPMRDPEALARLHAFPLWLARKLIVDLGPVSYTHLSFGA